MIDQHKLDLVARAGGNYYTRIRGAFFEISKPLRSMGIGVDALPDCIKNSSFLTGNDLGMQADDSVLPNQHSVDKFIADNSNFIGIKLNEKHKFAQEFLEKNDVESALKVLLS